MSWLVVQQKEPSAQEKTMALYQHDAVSVNIGERLRELREARNISMRALAARSGLSANALSMIERGKASPSVSTLYKLSDALGVSITAFFGSETEKKQAIFLKANERPHVSFTRGIFEGLGGEQFAGRIEPFLLTLESNANSGPRSMAHTGHEFVFCLRGELEYQVERQIFQLAAGDSLLFAAHLKHRWKNVGTTVVTALILISCFEEGEQLHAMHWKKGE
ncbi:MAG: helix-turn-helix domain-containing protein [Chloroflexi bacterium]|nr:MAG: helix-turn-helix domain-containing protein [Chloroflexota bacterium]